ncbi:hypothetical protein MMC07_005138 [Pseudocyphellaria aurata]|nr:hypothetical protein [Pseudocyphellaria aurata]
MILPPFAPFPPANLQKDIVPEEWQLCLDSWILLAQGNLLLPSKEFSLNILQDPSIIAFLLSYIAETSTSHAAPTIHALSAKNLRRECFLLVHRILTDVKPVPSALLDWTFLGNLSVIYVKSESFRSMLVGVYDRESLDGNASMRESKSSFVRLLEVNGDETSPDLDVVLRRAGALLKATYQYGQFLLLGSDFLDALSTAFEEGSSLLQKKLAVIGFLCLTSLLDSRRPKFSTLIDHLYSLNAASHYDSLLKGICSTTPLLAKMRGRLSGPESERAKPLMSQLAGFENSKLGKPKKLRTSKLKKGKIRDHDDYGHGAPGNVHVHQWTSVTQIQDLFPDLGSGFVVKLLGEFNNDAEQVIAHLLDGSLPSHLEHLDRTENLNGIPLLQSPLLEKTSSLPIRHNVFDNDAFDRLAISPSSLHLGRANASLTADNILSTRPPSSKAAILSALATFDSDSDERDDTYDVEDVGGTVDSAAPASDEMNSNLRNENEETLFTLFKRSPEVFERDAMTRRGKARAALKSETDMTDEALEGWAIMIGRDPRRLRRLEAKFSLLPASGSSGQRELAATSYRESSAVEEDSDTFVGHTSRGGQDRGRERGARGLGRGRGRGGQGSRGGDVAGPAGDRETQIARQRKDAGKGSCANHNRRDQRARKMARGGFPG